MNRSQKPEAPRGLIGAAAGSQPLKSPMTATSRALGAQRGELDARHAVALGEVGAELVVGAVVRPLGQEVEVEVGQGRRDGGRASSPRPAAGRAPPGVTIPWRGIRTQSGRLFSS